MRRALRVLTQNWQLKLAALTLALLLWVVVSAEQITTQWLPVPVEPLDRAPDYVIVDGPHPGEVEVLFAGPGRELWELALERPVLVLPVAGGEGEDAVLGLDPRMVRLPNGLSVTPRDVRPSTVRLRLQRMVSREVPVRLRVTARTRARYIFTDTPALHPARVRVTGPAAQVARIQAISTRPLEISEADSVLDRVVRLDADSLGEAALSTSAVRVTGRVDRRVERLVPDLLVAEVPGAEVVPARVDLILEGPSRAVRAVRREDLRLEFAPGALPAAPPPGGAIVPLNVRGLPPGVDARLSPGSVRVRPPGGPPAVLPEEPAAPDTTPRGGTR
jgi:hypothetical protein